MPAGARQLIQKCDKGHVGILAHWRACALVKDSTQQGQEGCAET